MQYTKDKRRIYGLDSSYDHKIRFDKTKQHSSIEVNQVSFKGSNLGYINYKE